ncbi:TetR/AcrR family transcriptional regulator [Alteromonas oceanisediminis]|uniref:TetR/AcrR family transcriptional regulator n=1 Tax=Alteromonas oceanisediminis TaxID=2836180 RepID=UPI001BD96FB4|nr:TetR/AcrR family transcriptional regulator [Alteromonas oceanisediminis]MBT0586739.1 TetR/AcrR family transcriptional regulator [Alteromonas oceanisediminis]
MPRAPMYDVDEVMEQAIDVFLEHGFHGTVMDEIIARTDFNRRGFYLEFGSKQAFLYRVIQFYIDTQLQRVIAALESDSGVQAIDDFFSRYLALIGGRGCLLINCVAELGFDDPTIRDMGRHYIDRLQIDFIACVEQAVNHHELRPETNIEAIALQLTSYVQGFAINAILAQDADELKLATQTLLRGNR